MNVLAGADLFTVEVLSWRGLLTYYVLFFIHLESRRASVTGIASCRGCKAIDFIEQSDGHSRETMPPSRHSVRMLSHAEAWIHKSFDK